MSTEIDVIGGSKNAFARFSCLFRKLILAMKILIKKTNFITLRLFNILCVKYLLIYVYDMSHYSLLVDSICVKQRECAYISVDGDGFFLTVAEIKK